MRERHVDPWEVWIGRGRPDRAEAELRRALREDPENARAQVMLALCLAALDRHQEALDESTRALALEANDPLAHYARGVALLGLKRYKPAESSAQRTIDLDPESPLGFTLLAQARGAQHRWADCLEAAQAGLELDPEDEDLLNLKALALIQLGDADAAGVALDAALRHDPENADTHRNLGWQALRRGEAGRAAEHYREALRLDPDDASARDGFVEALKSRNVVYRTFLRIVLLLTKVPPRTAMAILLGTIVARVLLLRLADAVPALAPVVWPLVLLVLAFVLATWIAPALFNLLLRFDRQGRHALTEAQVRQTEWLGGVILVSAVCAVLWLLGVPGAGHAAVYAAILTVPVTATFAPDRVGKRTPLALMTLGLVVAAGIVVATEFTYRDRFDAVGELIRELGDGPHTRDALEAALTRVPEATRAKLGSLVGDLPDALEGMRRAARWQRVFLWGFVAFTWLASGLFRRSG